MSESENQLPRLTNQEIKLIKLLRLQSEEKQKEIFNEVCNTNAVNEQPLESKDDDECAYWLNTKHYKK